MSVKQMGLVWELDLAPNKRLVLLAYADHADDDGDNVYPSLGRVAHKTGYSPQQIRRISRELVSDGLMELVEKNVGRSNANRYRLTLEKGVKMEPFTPKREAAKKVPSEPQKVTSLPEKVPPVVPEPSEPSVEPSNSVGSADADQPKKKGKAKPYVTQLVDLCRGVDFDPTGDQCKWWGAAINREVASGTSEKRIADIMGVIENQADKGAYCSWKQAKKILDGEVKLHDKHETNAKAEATPRDGVARLEAHTDLKGYAELARRFDFTSSSDPPWQVMNRLGGTPDEQYRNLTRIRSVVGSRTRDVDEEHARQLEENQRMLEEMLANG